MTALPETKLSGSRKAGWFNITHSGGAFWGLVTALPLAPAPFQPSRIVIVLRVIVSYVNQSNTVEIEIGLSILID